MAFKPIPAKYPPHQSLDIGYCSCSIRYMLEIRAAGFLNIGGRGSCTCFEAQLRACHCKLGLFQQRPIDSVLGFKVLRF